ncbi:MAG: aspartate aminotransferase family protein [candidate division NC10 bacterium]|nr:aspartate aminotransferase family protein [candidate division NC10 bacterium]
MREDHGSRVVGAYRRAHPTSEALFRRAKEAIPGGITHDIRHLKPFPLYVERARGSRKWDVDGYESIDYWMGHGALLLGHCHPDVTGAVAAQLEKGTHYGACHELEIRWAERVKRLIPSAEEVRFTMSGTEATQLAIRLARASTGKSKVVKFEGHFHGWHDYVMAGVKPPYAEPLSSGVPGRSLEDILRCPPNDLSRVEAFLRENEVAAVILEPGGGTAGAIPTDPRFLRGLRELATKTGVVLIFDEVITGFRYAPGGAQEYYGVTPDLTTLAKILAGGLPGGAVAGKAAIMDRLAFTDDVKGSRQKKVAHAGTFNANPLSASAGVAMLELIADGDAQKRASRAAELFRNGANEVIARLQVDVWVYGEASVFHVLLEPRRLGVGQPGSGEPLNHVALLSYPNLDLYHKLRLALILNGVDFPGLHGWVSAVHSDEDIERTVQAFERALTMLQEEGALG